MLKKFKIILVFASLSTTLCLMSNTYSRYVAGTTSNVEALFAKWEILINNTDITNNSTSQISFEPVIDENENVASNVVAPSSTGYFDIIIDPTNVDVSFKYSIDLSVANQNIPDLMITKYSVLPNNYVEGSTTLEKINISNNKIIDTLNFNKDNSSFKFEKFTIRVYFEWYDGENQTMDDNADTEVANSNTEFTMNANIEFEQVI